MTFRRRTTPTYYFSGSPLPAGYEYINDPSGNGDPGAAATIEGKLDVLGHPNRGTYYVGHAEDARSAIANRGMNVLAENTDILDDIVQTSIARHAFTTGTAVGATSTLVVTGDIWVGASGTPNTAAVRARLISILDANGNELTVDGNKVQVNLIHDGSSNNVIGNEFYTNPTVSLSPAIPSGVDYEVHYGIRSSYDDLRENYPGALSELAVRFGQEASGEVQSLLRSLHATTGQEWNDAWPSTMQALAASGLNERYRRQTAAPSSYTLDTAGDGATIIRDGIAPAAVTGFDQGAPHAAYARDFTNWSDPYLAHWLARMSGGTSASTGDGKRDGDAVGQNGFVTISHRLAMRGEDRQPPAVAPLINFWEHKDATTASPVQTGYFTYIEADAAAEIAEDTSTFSGTSGGDGVYRITLTGSGTLGDYYFWKQNVAGDEVTSVVVRKDCLRIDVPGVGSFLGCIIALDPANDDECVVRLMDGGQGLTGLPLSATPVVCTVTWLSTTMHYGGGGPVARDYFEGNAGGGFASEGQTTPAFEGLYVVEPPRMGEDIGTNYDDYRLADTLARVSTSGGALPLDSVPLAYFGAGHYDDTNLTKVFAWGHFDPRIDTSGWPSGEAAAYQTKGVLWNDGSVWSLGGSSKFSMLGLEDRTNNVSQGNGSGSHEWDPVADGGWLRVIFTGTGTEDLEITLPASYTSSARRRGDILYLTVQQAGSGTGTGVITWPANFRFSSPADEVPAAGPSAITLYKVFVLLETNQMLVEKISYP